VTAFSIACALLLAGALLFVLPPLWGRGSPGGAASQAALNLAVHRDALRELLAERTAGRLDAAEYAQARQELERRVLEDSAGAILPATFQGGRKPALAVGAAVPLLAIALYAGLGNPGALDPARRKGDDAAQSHPLSAEQIRAMVERLAQRLKDAPGDAEGWVMLARSYNVLGQYPNAATAYARAVSLLPGNAQVLADYADTMAMVQGRKLGGEPERIIQQALQADPNNIKALALAGTASFERQDFAAATQYWSRVLERVPPDSEVARSINGSIADARRRGGESAGVAQRAAGRLSGRVSVDAALRGKLRDDDTVFVFARATEGSRMPLAIVRKRVRDLPFEFVLDDSLAMQPGLSLSSLQVVAVGARISRSGEAAARQGDFEAALQQVKVGATQVELKIAAEVK
jgi:cytochrome c-type biogenesis protein CcmH